MCSDQGGGCPSDQIFGKKDISRGKIVVMREVG